MKTILIVAALALSGCASIQQPNGWVNPEGFTCDPSGACWPTDVAVTTNFRLVKMSPADILKAHSGSKEAAELHTEGRHAIAFTMTDLPSPIVVMPTYLTPRLVSCGWTMDLLLEHEKHHINGTTVHDMIGRTC